MPEVQAFQDRVTVFARQLDSTILTACGATALTLYVADTGNNLIRRIEVSTCTVTTLASVKQFSQMWGDGNNLYVVNWTSPLTVYQISLFTNEVSVLATIDVNIGGTPPGPVVGVWGDDANIYVGETLPFVVSVVHSINRSTGAVRLVASSATQSQSLLRIPQSLWSDGTYLYGGGVRIRVSTGELTSFPQASGSGVWGDRDNLYVTFGDEIRSVNWKTNALTTLVGLSAEPGTVDGCGNLARFNLPQAIWGDGSNLYVFDTGSRTIRRIELASGCVTTIAYLSQASQSAFAGIWGDGTNLYVTDPANFAVLRVNIATRTLQTWAGGHFGLADGIGQAAQFLEPRGIWGDGVSVYVADRWELRKIVIATAEVTTLAGSSDAPTAPRDGVGADARFVGIAGLWGGGNNLYLTDTGRGMPIIRKVVTASGEVSTVPNLENVLAFANSPYDTVNLWGHGYLLYFSDSVAETIIRFNLITGEANTVAGLNSARGSQDGVGTAARFNEPKALWGDETALYVSDELNHAIRRLSVLSSPQWEELGGVLASGPGVSSWGLGRLDAFAIGRDNALWHKSRDGSQWSGWESLGGFLMSDPAAVSRGPGRMDVFARGLDFAIWHRSFDSGAWSGWESLGGALISGPAVSSWSSNRLDVFALGIDSALWHKSWDGRQWSSWESLGGFLTSDPSAVSWGPGRIDVFARGSDFAIWHKSFDSTAWSSWESVGGVSISGPASSSWGVGRLDLFWVATDHELWHQSWAGSHWSDWESIGGAFTSKPAAVSCCSDRIDLFERDPNNELMHGFYIPAR